MDKVTRYINQLLDSCRLLDDERLYMPALTLLFCSVDFVAYLNRSDSKAGTTRNDFMSWVNQYMLPDEDVRCSAIDLYAARCSFVHSYSGIPSLVKNGQARRIFWEVGDVDRTPDLEERIKTQHKSSHAVVHTRALFNCFSYALDRWKSDFEHDQSMRERIVRNSQDLLEQIPIPADQ